MRLQHEAHLREIEAQSFKETAQTLGLTPAEMLNWRYVEVLRSLLTSNLSADAKSAIVANLPTELHEEGFASQTRVLS
jgi:hypothetical protein